MLEENAILLELSYLQSQCCKICQKKLQIKMHGMARRVLKQIFVSNKK